ncbi:MAG: hypothetical protein ACHQU0_03035 [Candidatus Paceibacteria bacterium]
METFTAPDHPKFVRWALMISIVVILNIFFSVVLALVYPAPQYNDFCPAQPLVTPTDATVCDAQGGIWHTYAPAPTDVKNPATPSGYCDMYAKCQKPFQAAQDQHGLYAFVIMVALGVVSLVIGFIPIGSSIVSAGLSYGGVLALIIGSASYWSSAGNWIRLAIATIGLVALLYIGWRRFRD